MQDVHLQTDGGGSGLNLACLQEPHRIVWVHQDAELGCAGREFPEQIQPLRPEFGYEQRHSCDVATRAREALDQSGLNRVPAARKHERDRLRCRLSRHRGDISASRRDDRDLLSNQFASERR
jgi:hypothetical protein